MQRVKYNPLSVPSLMERLSKLKPCEVLMLSSSIPLWKYGSLMYFMAFVLFIVLLTSCLFLFSIFCFQSFPNYNWELLYLSIHILRYFIRPLHDTLYFLSSNWQLTSWRSSWAIFVGNFTYIWYFQSAFNIKYFKTFGYYSYNTVFAVPRCTLCS